MQDVWVAWGQCCTTRNSTVRATATATATASVRLLGDPFGGTAKVVDLIFKIAQNEPFLKCRNDDDAWDNLKWRQFWATDNWQPATWELGNLGTWQLVQKRMHPARVLVGGLSNCGYMVHLPLSSSKIRIVFKLVRVHNCRHDETNKRQTMRHKSN